MAPFKKMNDKFALILKSNQFCIRLQSNFVSAVGSRGDRHTINVLLSELYFGIDSLYTVLRWNATQFPMFYRTQIHINQVSRIKIVFYYHIGYFNELLTNYQKKYIRNIHRTGLTYTICMLKYLLGFVGIALTEKITRSYNNCLL